MGERHFMTVQEAISAAARDVGAVGKNSRMEAGPARYNYRSLDDLVDAVSEPLAKHGVIFTPAQVQIIDTLERTTKTGSTQYHLRAVVTYRIYGPEGDSIVASTLAEGTDSGDKAGNKLMSTAYKYVLGQVLAIPYSMDDQDAALSEPVVPTTTSAVKDMIAQSAATLGRTMEEVTGKWRAEHGGISLDEMLALSPDRTGGFARQLSAYARTQAKK